MKTYSLVEDAENGCWMLLEDGIGMARSKSRNALRRIRDALTAENALVGLTVENRVDTMETRIDGFLRGVVLAFSSPYLVVRLADGKLDEWRTSNCRLVDPDPITKETLADDGPPIGVIPAVELLQRFLACGVENDGRELATVAEDVRKFLAAREAAQAVW